MVSERLKLFRTQREDAFTWFWRTAQQQEIDLIEERQGRFYAIKIKFKPLQKAAIPKTFSDNYDVEKCLVINSANYESFLYPERFE